jgi:hypothetical protein
VAFAASKSHARVRSLSASNTAANSSGTRSWAPCRSRSSGSVAWVRVALGCERCSKCLSAALSAESGTPTASSVGSVRGRAVERCSRHAAFPGPQTAPHVDLRGLVDRPPLRSSQRGGLSSKTVCLTSRA